jgi:hypothetical protein
LDIDSWFDGYLFSLDFTGFYWFLMVITGSNWFSLVLTGPYCVLLVIGLLDFPGLSGFYIQLVFTGI